MNAALARWLYLAAQHARGESVAAVLHELERSQHWPPERLRALQWERQQALVRHAFESVPFYRERWSAAGLSPDRLREPADWARLPVLERSDLQEHAAALTSSRAPRGGTKATTSGSSGMPVAVLRGHRSWAHAHANVFRGWRWHGLEIGDPYAYFWGLALDAAGRRQAGLRDAFFNRRRFSAFETDPSRAHAFYNGLRRRPVRFAFGYPSAVMQFAGQVREQGLDGCALGWRAVVTTAEMLRPHQREAMQETYGCRVVDSYGCAEIGVAGFECEAGGMHVPVESVVVDLERAAGDLYDILLTDLHNLVQPMIRYRIGDLVRPAETACPCGRALPLLGELQGRAGDAIVLPDGRRVSGLLPYYIFRHHAKSGKVREYQFVEFPGGRLELRITAGEGWSESVEREIREETSRGLGLPVEVRVVPRFERRGRGKHRDWVRAADIGE
jgi:phenylacetate-CoA ligase